MKRTVILMAIFTLFLAAAISAQDKPTNFTGNWELDAAKSKLDERMRVESMTMEISQTDKELKIQTMTKRAPRPDGDVSNNGGGMNRGGGGGMGRGMGGDGTITYNLDGNETKLEMNVNGMSGSSMLKANLEKDGKLKLTNARSFNTQMGEMMMTVKETWELADEGKTLKISREMETPRGTNSSELVFTKKDSTSISDSQTLVNPTMPRQVSGGVLNSKAKSLVLPGYPAAAKAVKASGAVNVQVTIDEQGNIISASAISGHPLLRQAAEEAARASQFAPTTLSGVPVRVTGVIVYNFVP